MKTTTLILTFVFTMMTAQSALADSNGSRNYNAEEEIKALMDCYAVGSDIITRAVDAPSVMGMYDSRQNLDNKTFAEGFRYYRGCSTRDWHVTVDVLGAPTGIETRGPLQWANFHNDGSRADQRRNMQHIIKPVSVEVKGDRGVIVAYAIVHAMYLPETMFAGTTQTLTIIYTSHVSRVNGRWLLNATNLNLTSISTSQAFL